jgi:hypothetical protein
VKADEHLFGIRLSVKIWCVSSSMTYIIDDVPFILRQNSVCGVLSLPCGKSKT